LPFKVENGTGHDLSLKDLSLIEHINKLAEMGVCSFKIEGRMKRPEYVSAAVKACKKSIKDEYNFDTQKDLADLFSRSGFTDGYYQNKLGKDMFGYREKENVQATTKDLLSKYSINYEKELPRYDVEFEFSGKIGEKAVVIAKYNNLIVKAESEMLCEAPINRPISSERVIDALSKCGGTQFNAKSVEINGEIDYSLPVSALNFMRRSAISMLEKEILGESERALNDAPLPSNAKSNNDKDIYLRFDNVGQIPEEAKDFVVFVPLGTDDEIVKENAYGVELPHGMFGNSERVEKLLSASSAYFALCHTLDAVAVAKKCGKKVVASPSMNILNSHSMDVAKELGISEAMVSNECTLDNFAKISAPIRKGITVYGKIPLMLTRNCPIKNGKSCAECKRNSEITDRMGISFPVKCFMGYSEILNSRPIYMADRLREIPSADILFFNFTTESTREVREILEAYENNKKPQIEFTRGLLYRGVE
jgi:putative protease